MNKKQLGYQFGRVFSSNFDSVCSAIAIAAGYASVKFFIGAEDISGIAAGTFMGLVAFESFGLGAIGLCARGLSYAESSIIKDNREKYPLEHPENIIIDDISGLEMVLRRTRNDELLEWGTFLRTYDDKGRAVVGEILDFHRANNLIKSRTEDSMYIDTVEAAKNGFNGFQHYHPAEGPIWFGAFNFAINTVDRHKPKGWMNLLTFNMPDGPEIIGFNRAYTYIPKDHSKKELVRATPRQIMEYLK